MNNQSYNQLNDYVYAVIVINGIAFVVDNYIQLREDYYQQKPS
jgi:hypothetical protein